MRSKIVILLLMIGFQVEAQNHDVITKGPWTLDNCIEYARKNNIQLQVLEKNTDLSEQDFLQAKAARLPNLSASFSQNFVHAAPGYTASGNSQTQSAFSGNYAVN